MTTTDTQNMAFIVNRKAITDALATLAPSISTRSTLPILSNVLIQASEQGVTLSAPNLETWSKVHLLGTDGIGDGNGTPYDCAITTQGCLTVPYKQLADILKTLTSQEMYFTQEDTVLKFEDSDAKAKINGIEASEYPAEPTINEVDEVQTITLPIETLRRMITLTQYAAADDDRRPVLTGINAKLKDNAFTFESGNEFILAIDSETVPYSGSWDNDVLIPARYLAGILKQLPEAKQPKKTKKDPNPAPVSAGNITITTCSSRNMATFTTERLTVHTRLLDGTFPNVQRVIPQYMNCIAECEVSDLKRALEGIKVVAAESSSICHFSVNGHIDVTATNENAELSRAVPAQTTNDEGEVSQIIFNYTLMQAFLAAHPHGTMQLELQGSTKPGKILYPDAPGFTGVIMPMHINR